MRKAILIALFLLAAWPPTASQTTAPVYGGLIAQNQRAKESLSGDEDIFSTADEQELLFRRVFQKSLPPLSKREAIIWSFRTAQPMPFQ